MKLDLPIHIKNRSFCELKQPIIEPNDGSPQDKRRKDLIIFLFTVFCCLIGIVFVFTSLYFYTESIDRFEDYLTEKERANLTEALKNNFVEEEKVNPTEASKVNFAETPELNPIETSKDSTPTLNCNCGLNYEPGFVPWQVSIESRSENETNHQCSGVIVNSNWVVTTASCALNLNPEASVIRVGLANLDDKNSSSYSYKVSRTFIHPSYNVYYGASVKDVGLVKLAEEIVLIENKVEPACLDLSKSYTEALDVEAFLVTAWDNAFEVEEHTNEMGFERFVGVRGCVEGFVECQNYIYATKLFPDSPFGEKGAPILSYSQSADKIIVEGLASHLDTSVFDEDLVFGYRFIKFARLATSKKFIENFVKNEYCAISL